MLKRDKNNNPIEVGGMKIHPLANMVPMATSEEQKALQASIQANGQREDVVLYRGQIVDGRCRALACELLGISVKFKELPHKTSIKKISKIVCDVNIRRNLTVSQKAIVAYREYKQSSLNQKKICEKWGVGQNTFTCVSFLDKNRPDYLSLIFEGKAILMSNGKQSSSVQIIAQQVKSDMERLKADAIDMSMATGFNPGGNIQTVAGQNWYRKAVEGIGGHNTSMFDAFPVKVLLASIADKNTQP